MRHRVDCNYIVEWVYNMLVFEETLDPLKMFSVYVHSKSKHIFELRFGSKVFVMSSDVSANELICKNLELPLEGYVTPSSCQREMKYPEPSSILN